MSYTLSDLQLIYQLLNHQWNLLIYGERDITWGERFVSWLQQFELYIWELMGFTTPQNRGYYALALVVVMGLGIIFAIYKSIGRPSLLDAMQQYCEKRKINKGSNSGTTVSSEQGEPVQAEETATETSTTITTVTAIVKPTVRIQSEKTKAIEPENMVLKSSAQASGSTTTMTTATLSGSSSTEKLFSQILVADPCAEVLKDVGSQSGPSGIQDTPLDSSKPFQVPPPIPLGNRSSSLRVLTSRDSFSDEFECRDVQAREDATVQPGQMETADLLEVFRQFVEAVGHEDLAPPPSTCDLEDAPSTVLQTTTKHSSHRDKGGVSEVSPYLVGKRTERHHRSSSYALGRFSQQPPEFDSSPIPNPPMTPIASTPRCSVSALSSILSSSFEQDAGHSMEHLESLDSNLKEVPLQVVHHPDSKFHPSENAVSLKMVKFRLAEKDEGPRMTIPNDGQNPDVAKTSEKSDKRLKKNRSASRQTLMIFKQTVSHRSESASPSFRTRHTIYEPVVQTNAEPMVSMDQEVISKKPCSSNLDTSIASGTQGTPQMLLPARVGNSKYKMTPGTRSKIQEGSGIQPRCPVSKLGRRSFTPQGSLSPGKYGSQHGSPIIPCKQPTCGWQPRESLIPRSIYNFPMFPQRPASHLHICNTPGRSRPPQISPDSSMREVVSANLEFSGRTQVQHRRQRRQAGKFTKTGGSRVRDKPSQAEGDSN